MPKMISDPEAKDPFKGYKPEKLGSGIRVDGKPLKDEAPAKSKPAKEEEDKGLNLKPVFARIKAEADAARAATAAKTEDRASRTNEMGDGYAKGGMTASRRADGCCTKGKTRGKLC